MDGLEIERQVRSALEHEARVNLHRYPIIVSFEADRTVVLEGELESIAGKKIALQLAASVGSCG